MKLMVIDDSCVAKTIKLKKGGFIETKPSLVSKSKNIWKEGLRGYIEKPVRREAKIVCITPTNDTFLFKLAVHDGMYTKIHIEDIIAVNGKEILDTTMKDKLQYKG